MPVASVAPLAALTGGIQNNNPFLNISDHAAQQMAGFRGDGGISNWSVQTILEGGDKALQANGRILSRINNFGSVVSETSGEVVTAWPETSAAGEESQGWVVQMLIFMLAVE